jgi:hypothetical protein
MDVVIADVIGDIALVLLAAWATGALARGGTGLSPRESAAVAVLVNTRGLTEPLLARVRLES